MHCKVLEVNTKIAGRMQHVYLHVQILNANTSKAVQASPFYHKICNSINWHFTIDQIGFDGLNITEIDILQGEEIFVLTRAESLRQYYPDNFIDKLDDIGELYPVIKPVKDITQLKADKKDKLLPFLQVLNYFTYQRSGDLKIGINTVDGQKIYNNLYTFLEYQNYNLRDMPLLCKEAFTYILPVTMDTDYLDLAYVHTPGKILVNGGIKIVIQ